MRPNPGRFFAVLFLPLWLFAGNHWELEVSKPDLYVGESALLRYVCYFDDEAYGTSIELKAQSNDAYTVDIFKERERVVDGKRENLFEFVVRPKRSGMIDVDLPAVLKKTSREQVKNAALGRDNVESYQFATTPQQLPPARLHVKPVQSVLVGDMSMKIDVDPKQVNAYEPLHVTLTLSGSGNLDAFESLKLEIPGVEVFSEAPERHYRLTPEGYSGSIVQRWALVASGPFTIPAWRLDTTRPEDGTLKRLTHPATSIEVVQDLNVASLLESDEATSEGSETSWFFYVLTLLSGIALGWQIRFWWEQRSKRQRRRKNESTGSAKVLLVELALQGADSALIARAEAEKWSVAKIRESIKSRQK